MGWVQDWDIFFPGQLSVKTGPGTASTLTALDSHPHIIAQKIPDGERKNT